MSIEKPVTKLDIAKIREDFPILGKSIDGSPLVYLDSAASAQKPQCVIDAVSDFYSNNYANIHRGNYALSRRATEDYELSRERIAAFIGAAHPRELIFTRGATEGVNLVAHSWAMQHLKPEDEILLTVMEHHANIVPWQIVAGKTGAVIKVAPINELGEIDRAEFDRMLTPRTKLVAFTHVSNTLGTVNPVKQLCALAHEMGAVVLVDGAQAVPHLPVNVQELGCDFYVFSGHKLFGPTGIGGLYGRESILSAMEPYQGGGDMIEHVSFERTTFKSIPERFEAGTPNIAGAIGLAMAVDYLSHFDRKALLDYEKALLEYATARMESIDGLHIVGKARDKACSISFHMPTAHHQDLADILDSEGIAVRTGHHCTEPLMRFLGLAGTARASFAFYNTVEEIDFFVDALRKAKKMLG